MTTYKAMTYTQLAAYAGVSRRTLYSWLSKHKKKLRQLGVTTNNKALSPAAVRYICEKFCIDID